MKRILVSFMMALIGGIVVFILGFQISLWIVLARTPDGHGTMVIPQMFSGVLLGVLGFIVVFIVSYVKLKKIERPARWGMGKLGASKKRLALQHKWHSIILYI